MLKLRGMARRDEGPVSMRKRAQHFQNNGYARTINAGTHVPHFFMSRANAAPATRTRDLAASAAFALVEGLRFVQMVTDATARGFARIVAARMDMFRSMKRRITVMGPGNPAHSIIPLHTFLVVQRRHGLERAARLLFQGDLLFMRRPNVTINSNRPDVFGDSPTTTLLSSAGEEFARLSTLFSGQQCAGRLRGVDGVVAPVGAEPSGLHQIDDSPSAVVEAGESGHCPADGAVPAAAIYDATGALLAHLEVVRHGGDRSVANAKLITSILSSTARDVSERCFRLH
jgi:hypothetical protein